MKIGTTNVHLLPHSDFNWGASKPPVYKEREKFGEIVSVKNVAQCNHFRIYIVDYSNQNEFSDSEPQEEEDEGVLGLKFIYKKTDEVVMPSNQSPLNNLFGCEFLLFLLSPLILYSKRKRKSRHENKVSKVYD